MFFILKCYWTAAHHYLQTVYLFHQTKSAFSWICAAPCPFSQWCICDHFDLKSQRTHTQAAHFSLFMQPCCDQYKQLPAPLPLRSWWLLQPTPFSGIRLCVRTRCRGAFRKHRPPQAVNRGQGQIPGCQMWRCGSGAVVVPVAGCTSWPCTCTYMPVMTCSGLFSLQCVGGKEAAFD